jgi:hypothetical protein
MREHGVRPLTAEDVAGSVGMDGKGVNLPTSTYENPGPTSNIRGIEPNTNIDAGMFPPEYQVVVAGERPVASEPFQVPQDLGDVDGDSSAGWAHPGNSPEMYLKPEWPQVGSFSKFGEHYPANGDQDGDGDSGADTDHDGM